MNNELSMLRDGNDAAFAERVLDAGNVGDGFGVVDGPLGATWVSFNDVGVSFVFVTDERSDFIERHRARLPRRLRPATVEPAVADALGRSDGSSLSVDLRHLGPFARDVLIATRSVQRGMTQSYGWLAESIGRPNAVRAVGTALGHNPIPLVIPCHRIVKADGTPGQYLFGTERKQSLLRFEQTP
jgi:methylated-DNA-[protein]-cysteine S-methyltransferase